MVKFNFKPEKQSYMDYLKKLIWVKKKKSSKKVKKEEVKEEQVEVLSLDELNK